MGTRLFGRIDAANRRPRATKFFHVLYLPLIPLGTYEILDEREGIANPTRFCGASVFAGYFKVWGPIASIVLSVWAFVELTTGEEWLAYSLPFAAIALMAAVIGSWLWLGTKRTRIRTSALALGIPVALMTGAYGYGFFRRMPIGPALAPLSEPPMPERIAERRIIERSVKRSSYQETLFAIARAHYEKKVWSKKRCTDEASGDLLLIEYNFIGKILKPTEMKPNMREWLVSEPLRDLGQVQIPDGTLDRLDAHRYVGVVTVRQERRLSRKRSILAGHLVVYDLSTREAICETPVRVTGRGRMERLRRKFLARIEKKLSEISKKLYLDRPPVT